MPMFDCSYVGVTLTQIIKKTREMFGKLNISVFYPLYKEFYIWSNEVSLFNFLIANKHMYICITYTYCAH